MNWQREGLSIDRQLIAMYILNELRPSSHLFFINSNSKISHKLIKSRFSKRNWKPKTIIRSAEREEVHRIEEIQVNRACKNTHRSPRNCKCPVNLSSFSWRYVRYQKPNRRRKAAIPVISPRANDETGANDGKVGSDAIPSKNGIRSKAR